MPDSLLPLSTVWLVCQHTYAQLILASPVCISGVFEGLPVRYMKAGGISPSRLTVLMSRLVFKAMLSVKVQQWCLTLCTYPCSHPVKLCFLVDHAYCLILSIHE